MTTWHVTVDERHSATYKVKADDEAGARDAMRNGLGELVDDSVEFVEVLGDADDWEVHEAAADGADGR